jgi:NADH-quinone oxidoreductase subunit L
MLSFHEFITIILKKKIVYVNMGNWVLCGNFFINWGISFDLLSISMILMISFISGAVHLFSISYMQTDFNIIRFFSLLSLFTFFMVVLVSADNFILLFLGWEGIGVCSYLLISF